MLRAILALGGTVAGLAALLSFKTHPAASAAPDASTPSTPAAASPTMSAAASPKMASGGASTAARVITGPAETTLYGPMQVKVTLEGQRITQVAVVQQTNDGGESQQIDSFSIPKLTSETLAAQSAHIDAVTGATYTSSGYTKSLQGALDQASA